jgi:hypothetical protein
MQLPFIGGDLGAVAEPSAVERGRREVPLDQVRCPPPAFAWPGRGLAFLLSPGRQAELTHERCDGVLAHPPSRLAQISGDPRRTVLAVMQPEQAGDLGFEPLPPLRPRR